MSLDIQRLPPCEKQHLRLGYLRLTDSAPLIMARELGLYQRYGLDVDLWPGGVLGQCPGQTGGRRPRCQPDAGALATGDLPGRRRPAGRCNHRSRPEHEMATRSPSVKSWREPSCPVLPRHRSGRGNPRSPWGATCASDPAPRRWCWPRLIPFPVTPSSCSIGCAREGSTPPGM